MDKVKKFSYLKCYTPSSEPFRIYLLFYPENRNSPFFRNMVNIYQNTRRHIPYDSNEQLFIVTRLYELIRTFIAVKTGISFKYSSGSAVLGETALYFS
jgi:hypothetical protein